MNHTALLTLALSLGLPLSASAAPVTDAAAALQRITATQHVAPYELEFRNGYWTAEATTAEGLRVDLLVDPQTGAVNAFDHRGAGAISAQRVRELILAAGYQRVSDIEFDDGFWEAEAVDAYGRERDLVLHPLTGAILTPADSTSPQGATPLTSQQVLAALTAAGYTRIHDLDYDEDGYWEADATNASGQRVELRVDPFTGAVLREELDD